MSEYQYYEFVAIERPLIDKEMTELRSRSSRATITPTSFINEYNWGKMLAFARHASHILRPWIMTAAGRILTNRPRAERLRAMKKQSERWPISPVPTI